MPESWGAARCGASAWHAELLAEMERGPALIATPVHIVPPSWEGDRNDLGARCRRPARPTQSFLPSWGALSIRDGRRRLLRSTMQTARETIKDWKKQPGMLGMRFTFSYRGAASAAASTGRSTGCGARWRRAAFPPWCCSITSTCTSRRQARRALSRLAAGARPSWPEERRDVTEAVELRHARQCAGACQARPTWRPRSRPVPCYADDKTYPFKSVHPAHPACLRRLRTEAHLLGHRLVAAALQLSPGRHDVHRRDAVAEGQDLDGVIGSRRVRLARLEVLRTGGFLTRFRRFPTDLTEL